VLRILNYNGQITFGSGNKFAINRNKKQEGESELAILFSNDAHGKIGKLPNLKTARDEFVSSFKDKDAASFVLTTGDNFIGSSSKIYTIWSEFLNNFFKPEAQTIGNHEFDHSFEHCAKIINNSNIPTLAGNLFALENKMFDDMKKNGKLINSTVIEKSGQKYGFIGVTATDIFEYKSRESVDGLDVFDFEKTREIIKNEIEKLQKQGINKIILLSHLGYIPDLLIAGAFENIENEKEKNILSKTISLKGIKTFEGLRGIDIIIGGHSHEEIQGSNSIEKIRQLNKDYSSSDLEILTSLKGTYVNLVTPENAEPVLIAQGGAENNYVGFIDVIFNEKGAIKKDKIINKLLSVSDFKENKKVSAYISKIIGKKQDILTLKTPFVDPQRKSENAIQNMLADSIIKKANHELPKADIALIHGAAARGGLSGKVSNWDIEHDILPFSDKVYMIKLSEKDLVDTVNNTAVRSLVLIGKPVLMHPSKNLRYTISNTPKILENGKKLYVRDITITDKNGKERKIDLINPSVKKEFNVLVEEYFLQGEPCLGGKEGFEALALEGFAKYIAGLAQKPEGILKEYNWSSKDVFIEYLNKKYKGKEIEFLPDGRITIIKDEPVETKTA